ncbi:MAG TPA: hypothetical protein VLH08_19450 [Acidobacteriota bacterium]|nr:hypothetical protein [Acidobacteriota bacterium]
MNRAQLSDEQLAVFKNELAEHRSLQDLLRWAERQPDGALVPGAIAELVVQDEFTHDLVVHWRGFYIVYGTT